MKTQRKKTQFKEKCHREQNNLKNKHFNDFPIPNFKY